MSFVKETYIYSSHTHAHVLHQLLVELPYLVFENHESLLDDVDWWECSSSLDCEVKFIVILPKSYCFVVTWCELVHISVALSAKITFVGIFDLHGLLQLVKLINFPGALLDEGPSLISCEAILSVDLLLIDLDLWLLMHDASGHRGPLGVLLADTLFGLELEVKLLVRPQLHDRDWILWLTSLTIHELYWLH